MNRHRRRNSDQDRVKQLQSMVLAGDLSYETIIELAALYEKAAHEIEKAAREAAQEPDADDYIMDSHLEVTILRPKKTVVVVKPLDEREWRSLENFATRGYGKHRHIPIVSRLVLFSLPRHMQPSELTVKSAIQLSRGEASTIAAEAETNKHKPPSRQGQRALFPGVRRNFDQI